jgi:hypothetical protein
MVRDGNNAVLTLPRAFSGINPLATSYELVHYFETAKPKLIAVDETMLSNVEEALKVIKLPFPPKVLVIQGHSTRRTNIRLPQVRKRDRKAIFLQ